jgi:predicted acetyltransferase
MAIHLVKPSIELLPSYLEAVQEGKYCNMALGFGDDALSEIMKDKDAYVQKLNSPVPFKFKLPDGSEFEITDHELYWITDGKRFIGSVPLRFAGDADFIENFCGHTGMAIRPSLINRGYGVKALMHAFELGGGIAKAKGLDYILASCDKKNTASMRLIEHAGGKLFRSHDGFCGAEPNLIYQIFL